MAEVAGYIDDGYKRVKLKIQPGWDIVPTRLVRETWPDMPLQVDANQAYSRHDIDHLCGLDEFDLLLVEQPIHEEDYLGHKLLAERMRTPVCLDESVLSVDNAESLIDYGACEIVNIKAGRVGGYLSAQGDPRHGARSRRAGVVRRHGRDRPRARGQRGPRVAAGLHAAGRHQRLGPLLHAGPHGAVHDPRRDDDRADRARPRRGADPRGARGAHGRAPRSSSHSSSRSRASTRRP